MSNGSLFYLISQLYFLKRLPRQGWIRAGVPISEVESVADHSYGVAILALILCPLENKLRRKSGLQNLDIERTLSIALAHDLAECKFQDLDHSLARLCGEESFSRFKRKAEESGLLQIQREINSSIGIETDLVFLIQEESPELQFIHELDKLDVILQAMDYNQRGVSPNGVKSLLKEVRETLQNPKSLCLRQVLSNIDDELLK